MAKRPFKKYNSKASVDAVLVTKDNIEDLATQIGGVFMEEGNGGPQAVLILPGIPTAIEAHYGDYVTVAGNGRYDVIPMETFEEQYKIPKMVMDEDDAEDDE